MKNIYAALLEVQSELKPIIKDETNPFFKSKYFDINGLISELRPLLTKHGLIVMQPLTVIKFGEPEIDNPRMAIETIICHAESGEAFSRTTTLIETSDVQKLGATITYQRRYALASMFLIDSEDDDGNTAIDKPKAPVASPSAPQSLPDVSLGTCTKCGTPLIPGKGGKPYCKPCYVAYAESKKTAEKIPVIQQEAAPLDGLEWITENIGSG